MRYVEKAQDTESLEEPAMHVINHRKAKSREMQEKDFGITMTFVGDVGQIMMKGMGQAFGLAARTWVGRPSSHVKCLGSPPASTPHSSFCKCEPWEAAGGGSGS